MNSRFYFWCKNIRSSDWLPAQWEESLREVCRQYSSEVVLDGSSSTTREPTGATTSLSILDGEIINRNLPWLHKLYSTNLLKQAEAIEGRQLETSKSIVSGVNINYFSARGGRYERHVDSNPVTALLFGSTISPETGGALVFEEDGRPFLKVQPLAGLLCIFNAQDTVHYTEPMLNDAERISIPMNFYIKGEVQYRPLDLDKYLYSK